MGKILEIFATEYKGLQDETEGKSQGTYLVYAGSKSLED